MLTLASYLAESARPVYERVAGHVARRLGEEDDDGRAILAAGQIERFVAAQDADDDLIRQMVRRAEAAGFLILR